MAEINTWKLPLQLSPVRCQRFGTIFPLLTFPCVCSQRMQDKAGTSCVCKHICKMSPLCQHNVQHKTVSAVVETIGLPDSRQGFLGSCLIFWFFFPVKCWILSSVQREQRGMVRNILCSQSHCWSCSLSLCKSSLRV